MDNIIPYHIKTFELSASNEGQLRALVREAFLEALTKAVNDKVLMDVIVKAVFDEKLERERLRKRNTLLGRLWFGD